MAQLASPRRRLRVLGGLLAVVLGLPALVVLTDWPERVPSAVGTAHAVDAIAIATSVRISERLPLTLDKGLVTTSEQGQGVGGRGPSSISIEEAQLTLDLSEGSAAAGRAVPGPETKPDAMPAIAGFRSGTVRLKRAAITIIGPHGTQAALSDVNATVTVTRKGSFRLVGAGQLGGQALSIEAMWSDGATREASPQVPLRVTLRSALLEATIDGLYRTGEAPSFSGHAEFRLPSLKRFAGWVGLGDGISEQLAAFTVAGPLEWSPRLMSFARASIGLDGHLATGAVAVRHDGSRLKVEGTLGFDELDIGRYLARWGQPGPTEPGRRHVLTEIDADLRLSAAKVIAPGLDMRRGAISIALSQGHLQADMAELEIEGGVAGGQLTADFNDPGAASAIKLKVRGVDVGRTLAATLKRNPLLGRTNVTFEGTVGGRAASGFVSSISGRGQFDLAEAGRLGIDLAALQHAARGGAPVGWSAAGRGATPVESLSGRFRVLNGAVTIEAAVARSGSSTFVCSGRLDVPGRLMDLTVASGPVIAADSPAASQDVLVFRGTWDTPAISLSRQLRPQHKVEVPSRAHH